MIAMSHLDIHWFAIPLKFLPHLIGIGTIHSLTDYFSFATRYLDIYFVYPQCSFGNL